MKPNLSLVFLCKSKNKHVVIGRLSMDLEAYTKEKLWQLLVEAVHLSVMYPTHKAYVRDSILPSNPDVSARELTERLGMPFGEALVILDELLAAKKDTT